MLEVYDDNFDRGGEINVLLGSARIMVEKSVLGIGPIEEALHDLYGNPTGAFLEL